MRISAGEFKGRKTGKKRLFSRGPGDNDLRPTSSKVREAIFDILRPYIDGAAFLDLYAGTGTVGIEALSRGAGLAVLVETVKSRAKAINDLIEKFGLSGRASVETERADAFLARAGRSGRRFDIIFLDPPYSTEDIAEILPMIGSYGILSEACILLCEHSAKTLLPESAGGLKLKKRYRYGDSSLSLYRKEI